MPQKLHSVSLDEVSLVDTPAAQGARVVLMKKDSTPKTKGVQFNLGFDEEGKSAVQSVVFSKESWDVEKAKAWLKEHKMTGDKVDEKENTLRFRQADPGKFQKFRMITPGAEVSKALKASQSLMRVQEAVSRAVRDKFTSAVSSSLAASAYPSTPWVRDLYKDSAVFDLDGQTYRVAYTLDLTGDEPVVSLGEKVLVEVAYVDVGKACAPCVEKKPLKDEDEGEDDEIDELMTTRLKKLTERLAILNDNVGKYNKNHGADGRFTSGGGRGGSGGGSANPKSSAMDASNKADTLGDRALKNFGERNPVAYKYALTNKVAPAHLAAEMKWREVGAIARKENNTRLSTQSSRAVNRHVAARNTALKTAASL